jgi:hypothetical protein
MDRLIAHRSLKMVLILWMAVCVWFSGGQAVHAATADPVRVTALSNDKWYFEWDPISPANWYRVVLGMSSGYAQSTSYERNTIFALDLSGYDNISVTVIGIQVYGVDEKGNYLTRESGRKSMTFKPAQELTPDGMLDALQKGFDRVAVTTTNLPELFAADLGVSLQRMLGELWKTVTIWMGIIQNKMQSDDVTSIPIVQAVEQAVRPIAYSLLALFFVMEFSSKTIRFESASNEGIAKVILQLLFAKYMTDSSLYLIGLILDVNRELVGLIFNVGRVENLNDLINFQATFSPTAMGFVQGVMENMLAAIGLLIAGLVIMVLWLLIYAIIYIRVIELCVMTAISPLFFATLAGDVTNDVFRGYIKSFVALALQTTFMSVSIVFFSNGLVNLMSPGSSMFSSVTDFLIGMLTLAIFMLKTPNSLRQALGGGGASASMSSLLLLVRR